MTQGTCPAIHPEKNRRCELEAGHDRDHFANMPAGVRGVLAWSDPAAPDWPAHRVAVVLHLNLPAPDYSTAARYASDAVGRWLDLHTGRTFPVYTYRGYVVGNAEIIGVDSVGEALRTGRLQISPPLQDTPTQVHEEAERLGSDESE